MSFLIYRFNADSIKRGGKFMQKMLLILRTDKVCVRFVHVSLSFTAGSQSAGVCG